MKNLLLALPLFLCSCPLTGQDFQPQEQSEMVQLHNETVDLQEQLEAAADPVERAVIQAEIQANETRMAEIEQFAYQRKYGAVGQALASFGPIGAAASGVFTAFLLPLAGKRGRKNYGNMLKNLTPWVNPPKNSDGSRGMSPFAAIKDVGRAIGVLHSSESSASAAETTS